jgi:serine/threonine-protein kinase
VALTPGLSPGSSEEIAALLVKHLRVGVLIGVGFTLMCFVLRFWRYPLETHTVWLVYVPAGVYLAVITVSAIILWRMHTPSLRLLRVFEIAGYGLAAAYVAWDHYNSFFLTNDWFPQFMQGDASSISLLARHPSFLWFVLIVSYGTLIPNTGRRCAAVTVVMALAPLTLTAVGGSFHPEIPTQFLVICLAEMAMFMVVAVTLAIFGSHKINALRQEALEARKLGQYRLKERLGVGGMGEVYLAEHLLLRRPCAVKLIRPERAGDPRNLARFEREVQATVALSHPNIVEVFDYGHTEGGTFYYVMEYLPGLNLEEFTRRHAPLALGRIVHLLRQACAALHEAHAAGLIHRDIKPSNILVCQRGGRHDVVKLLDFGLVQAHGLSGGGQQLTQEGAIAGTPAYMSPEQGAGRDVDARSDLYSLGAVAYFLLTGRPPFVRDSVVQTLAAHLGEPVVPPNRHRLDVPADLQAVVQRCLEKDPARRFADADELAQALARCSCADQWTREQAAAWWRDSAAGNPQTTVEGAGSHSLRASV